MVVYLKPVATAATLFFILSVALTVPWAIYQYRKHGYFSVWKSILLASFLFYGMSAYFLVILPLPAVRDNCQVLGPLSSYMQTNPFQFIHDIKRESAVVWSDWRSYRQLIQVPAFYQLFFNVLLLFPLGVYARYVWQRKRDVWKVALLGFFTSLFFEVTQLTGLYGLYKCPYRLFDVDDLLANTTGALLGFFIAPLFLMLVPSKQQLIQRDEKMERQKEATRGAELLALLIDLVIAQFVSTVLSNLTGWSERLLFLIILGALQVVYPLVKDGRTLGSTVVRIRYVSIDPVVWKALLKRWLAIALPYAFGMLATFLNEQVPFVEGFDLLFILAIVGISLLVFAWVAMHIIWRLIRQNKPFYFDHYSGIVAVNIRKEGEVT